jgi:hypothetical protein
MESLHHHDKQRRPCTLQDLDIQAAAEDSDRVTLHSLKTVDRARGCRVE